MAPVAVRHLNKDFGGLEVLKDVSIDIADGQFVALVDPSGCGKSTLLRTVAGLETISSGTISIGGPVINDLPPKTRDIARSAPPEKLNLFDAETGASLSQFVRREAA